MKIPEKLNPTFETRAQCPICTSDKSKLLFDIPLTEPKIFDFLQEKYQNIPKAVLEFNYTVTKCQDCGLIYQKHVLNEENIFQLYESWISSSDSQRKCKNNQTYAAASTRVSELLGVSNLLKKEPHDINILEYGMGWGDWLNIASSLGYQVTGLELSRERTESTKTNGIAVVNELSQIADNSLDFVYSNQVFEHLKQPLLVLREISKKMKSGGIVCIKVPNGNNIESQIAKQINAPWLIKQIHPLEHINCYNRKTLRLLGEKSGLEVTSGPYYPKAGNIFEYVKSNIKYLVDRHSNSQVYLRKK